MIEETEAKEKLKDLLKKADFKVYTLLRHVSQSGMLRRISAFVIINNEPYEIDYLLAKIGFKRGDMNHEGIIISGCGMDMGFSLVYDLSSTLYGSEHKNAYKLKQKWI